MKTKKWQPTAFFILIAIFASLKMYATNCEVRGIVCDDMGNPIEGVNIKQLDTNHQTRTNSKGEYSITTDTNSILEYTYLGYETVTKKISESAVINIVLYPLILSESSATDRYYIARDKKMANTSMKPIISRTLCVSSLSYPNYVLTEEEYTKHNENRFISPLNEALSTFSIDVDGASYSNFRRMINQGQLPPNEAVRVEEFVNYFKYNYDQPTSKDPIKFTTEVGQCPWAKDHRLLRIGIKAKEIDKENLPASNLVFLIDVSGSMFGPTRLDLVKSSMKLLTNNLRANDRVAIVAYAGSAGLVLPSTAGRNKEVIIDALENLEAGGSTAGGAGIQLAYKIAKDNFIKGGNNRIILCTDGDFNVGVSSNDELESLIEKERKAGVYLSILGYGMGNYKDSKMQILAEKGNGNASYIDNLQEANRVLVNEFGATLFTVAKDVKLQIEFNPAKVQSYRLVGYESRLLNKEDFNDDTKDAGEMGAGHTVTALYEIVPMGIKSDIYGSVDNLKYQQTNTPSGNKLTNSPELCTVKLRYKQPDGDKSVKLEIPVVDKGNNKVSADMQFASAVAMFAQLIKDSDFKGTATYNDVIDLARSGLDNDHNGYRREFVRLVETTKNLK